MSDPSDPVDTTFQRLLNREILVSERRRMLILAALQAFILVLILLAATVEPARGRDNPCNYRDEGDDETGDNSSCYHRGRPSFVVKELHHSRYLPAKIAPACTVLSSTSDRVAGLNRLRASKPSQ